MIFCKTWEAQNALGLAFDKGSWPVDPGTQVILQEFAPLLLELWPKVPPIVPPALL